MDEKLQATLKELIANALSDLQLASNTVDAQNAYDAYALFGAASLSIDEAIVALYKAGVR